MLKIAGVVAILISSLLTIGCTSHPEPIDTSHLVALRLESIDLEADRIEFALYNTTEWELPIAACGDYYLGEVLVIADGRASVFMINDIATGRLVATFGYERSPPLAAGDCVRWVLSLSEIVRTSGENDMESLLLDDQMQRREQYERDPDAYRAAHGIPANRTPMFTDKEPLPLPPTLLEYLHRHPDSIVAIQPVYVWVGSPLNQGPGSTSSYRGRSNWMSPVRRP